MLQVLGGVAAPDFISDLIGRGAAPVELLDYVLGNSDPSQKARGCIFLAKNFLAQDFPLEQFASLLEQGPAYLAYNFLHPDPAIPKRAANELSFDKVQFLLNNPGIRLNAIHSDCQSTPAERALIIAASQVVLDRPTVRFLATFQEVAEQLPIIRPHEVLDSELTQAVIGMRTNRPCHEIKEIAQIVLRAA